MKFISFGPNYYSLIGHGIPYQSCLYKTCQALNLSFLFLLPKDSPIEKMDFDCKRYFSKNVLKRFLDYLKIFNISSEPTIFFIETFKAIDLIFLMLAIPLVKKRDRLLLLFRKGIKDNFWHRTISTFILKCFSLKKQIAFLTDSELISDQFLQILGFKIDILPIPHTFTLGRNYVPIKDKIICYWPGEPRPSKGLKEIRALSEIIDRQKYELIAVHSSKLKNAHLINDCLSREEYIDYLLHCDVVLLPYDPVVYKYGTSGIFVEAICLGKFLLVKEGSWLAYELRKHELEELIVDWNAPNFFTLLRGLYSSAKIQEKLFLMKEQYRRFHKQATFDEFFAKFLSIK